MAGGYVLGFLTRPRIAPRPNRREILTPAEAFDRFFATNQAFAIDDPNENETT